MSTTPTPTTTTQTNPATTERRNLEPTLVDGMTADLGGPRTGALLDRLDALVPWERLAEPVRRLYRHGEQGGRRPWPAVTMLKSALLGQWFGLSDPQLEEQLRDRLSFRRFVGLSLEDRTPDETTFVRFRGRLREAGLDATLFAQVNAHLEQRGLILHTGTLVDATLLEAPRPRPRKPDARPRKPDPRNFRGSQDPQKPCQSSDSGPRPGKPSPREVTGSGKTRAAPGDTPRAAHEMRDADASFTKKHGRTYHGYKASIATDRRGMIKRIVFDTARVHDSQHFDELTRDEPAGGAVFADSAYMDQQRSAELERRGVFDGILRRRVRGQPELDEADRLLNKLCASMRAAVEHPFAWIKQMRSGRARYRGLRRNAYDFTLAATAYNLKRSLSLVPT